MFFVNYLFESVIEMQNGLSQLEEDEFGFERKREKKGKDSEAAKRSIQGLNLIKRFTFVIFERSK
jgi:hypothetical protein